MTLSDGQLRESGIWGMRVDYWDDVTSSYPPESSLFFYDIKENLTVGSDPPYCWNYGHLPLSICQACRLSAGECQ